MTPSLFWLIDGISRCVSSFYCFFKFMILLLFWLCHRSYIFYFGLDDSIVGKILKNLLNENTVYSIYVSIKLLLLQLHIRFWWYYRTTVWNGDSRLNKWLILQFLWLYSNAKRRLPAAWNSTVCTSLSNLRTTTLRWNQQTKKKDIFPCLRV